MKGMEDRLSRAELSSALLICFFLSAPSPTSAQPYCAYVANSESDFVSLIDTATNTVTATVVESCGPAGRCDPSAVAIAPDGRFVYVKNESGGSVSVINAATNTVTASVPVPIGGGDIAITPDGRFAYVTNMGFTEKPPGPGNTVSVIDTATHVVTDTISVGSLPIGVVLTPDGGVAYVGTCGSPCDGSAVRVSEIDTITKTVRRTVPGGVRNALTPDGRLLYGISNSLLVVNLATLAITNTIPVGTFPFDVAIAPNGQFVYVVNCGEGCFDKQGAVSGSSVAVIRTATNAVVATVPFPAANSPVAVAITPDGAFAYVANSFSNTVSVIDTAKARTDPEHAIIATVPVDCRPFNCRPFAIAIASFACGKPPLCPGDCNGDGEVTVDELLKMVNIALGSLLVSDCQVGDANNDQQITIDEILTAVNKALNGCS